MINQCINCNKNFRIEDHDLEFYKRISVPAPTHCPDCRQQRRLAWRNEHTLYNRACDLCHKAIIAIYPADSKYKVYCHDCWYSESWSAQDYSKDIDWSRPFFTQWQELQQAVPKIALYAANNEQSEYVNMTGYSKNCYLIFAGDYDEDCLYGTQVIKSVSCVDVLNCIESEDCYEAVDIEKCYRLWFSQNCKSCTDSMFLFDCRGCTDCIFSANLRNKRYYIFNKEYSAEEYQTKKAQVLADLNVGKQTELLQQFKDLCVKAIHRPVEVGSSEGSTGDYIFNSHAARNCYDVTSVDNCAYVYSGFQVKDQMDVCHTTDVELGYESTSVGYTDYNCRFCVCAWTARDCSYCLQVKDSHDLFGCIGLTKASFCILNKQYSEADYKATVAKLIQHMTTTHEYGEFFPIELSPFAYNATVAQTWYPITAEQAKQNGWSWSESEAPVSRANDATAKNVLVCSVTGKQYRVVQAELDWYKRMGLPLPTICPDERRQQRFQQRNPRQLWQRQCMCTQVDHGSTSSPRVASRCSEEFTTTYSPERKELIYCEACYQKEIL